MSGSQGGAQPTEYQKTMSTHVRQGQMGTMVSPVPMQWGGQMMNEYDAQGFAMPGAYDSAFAMQQQQYQQQQQMMAQPTMTYNYGMGMTMGTGTAMQSPVHMQTAYQSPGHMQQHDGAAGFLYPMTTASRTAGEPAEEAREERKTIPRDRNGQPIPALGEMAGPSTTTRATISRQTEYKDDEENDYSSTPPPEAETREDPKEKELELIVKMMRAMGETLGDRQAAMMEKMLQTFTDKKEIGSKNVLTSAHWRRYRSSEPRHRPSGRV